MTGVLSMRTISRATRPPQSRLANDAGIITAEVRALAPARRGTRWTPRSRPLIPAGSASSRPLRVCVACGVGLAVLITGFTSTALAGVGLAAAVAAGAAPACRAPTAPPKFLVGVWQPPDSSFAKWRARGVNTVVDDLNLQTSDPFPVWEHKLACQDLFAIRQPQQSLAKENRDTRLLALAQRDEPDIHLVPAAQLKATYGNWKAGAPKKPVYVNLAGSTLFSLLAGRQELAAGSTDVRALESPDGLSRTEGTFDGPAVPLPCSARQAGGKGTSPCSRTVGELALRLRLQAAFIGNLHLYAVDWGSQGRRETITVATGAKSQTVGLGSDFSQGAWITFPVSAPAGATVNITIERTAGPNAVLSGIFLGDDTPSPPVGSPQVASAPQGNWVGVYGADGYDLAAFHGNSDEVSNLQVNVGIGSMVRQTYDGWISAANWVSADIYPVSALDRPDLLDLTPGAPSAIGAVQDLLAQWSSSRPRYEFIEASQQFPASQARAPTPDEFRGEIWDSIIHGVHGIIYFPSSTHAVDAVPPNISTEMVTQDRLLARLDPMLVSPGTRPAAPPPFEVATRTYCGVTYTITLNLSDQVATYLGAVYAPDQVRISPQPLRALGTCQ